MCIFEPYESITQFFGNLNGTDATEVDIFLIGHTDHGDDVFSSHDVDDFLISIIDPDVTYRE